MEKVQPYCTWLKTTRIHQKLYVDVRRKELKFAISCWVYLKVSHMLEVISFGKKGTRNPHYNSSYEILRYIGDIPDEQDLPSEIVIAHQFFHVYMSKKCIQERSLVVPI